jgi:hypothetical protein
VRPTRTPAAPGPTVARTVTVTVTPGPAQWKQLSLTVSALPPGAGGPGRPGRRSVRHDTVTVRWAAAAAAARAGAGCRINLASDAAIMMAQSKASEAALHGSCYPPDL